MNTLVGNVGIAAMDELIGGHLGAAYERFIVPNRLLSVHIPVEIGGGSNLNMGSDRSPDASGNFEYVAPGIRIHTQLLSRRRADGRFGPSLILGTGYYHKVYPLGYSSHYVNVDEHFRFTGLSWETAVNVLTSGTSNFIFGVTTTEGVVYSWHGQTVFLFQLGITIGGGF